jgi:hypothetical protein
MKRISGLNANQVAKELQGYKRYKGKTQKEIKDKLGGVNHLRDELNRLEQKYTDKKSVKSVKSKKSVKKSVKSKSNIVPLLPLDTMNDVLLHSDINTLNSYCSTNKQGNKLCHDKVFWQKKFELHNFHFPSILEDHFKTYNKLFEFIEENMKDTKIILKINNIEKNRNYNATDGTILVNIEDMEADELDYLLLQKLDRDKDGCMNYNTMIFELTDKGYLIKLQKMYDTPIDIKYINEKDTERLLSYALTSTGICSDSRYNSFLSMNEEIFDEEDIYDVVNASKIVVVSLRRGLWEGMLSK